MRVQIPAYTDRWMMGDRYGEVVKVTGPKPKRKTAIIAELSNLSRNGWANAKSVDYAPLERELREIAHVKLDVSGKTMKFILDDCTEA
jgi:hypothetical protein